MRNAVAALLLPLILSLPAGAGVASAQGPLLGSPARGEVVAGARCSQCHRALPDEQWALENGAVAFQDLAADPERGVAFLRELMSRPHPFMPFDTLSGRDREDILAYMFWLLPRQ